MAYAEGAEAAAAWRAVSRADTGSESRADKQPTAAAVPTAELLLKYSLSDQTSSESATERPASEYCLNNSCPGHSW